jgi:hypothetical protein
VTTDLHPKALTNLIWNLSRIPGEEETILKLPDDLGLLRGHGTTIPFQADRSVVVLHVKPGGNDIPQPQAPCAATVMSLFSTSKKAPCIAALLSAGI